LTKIKFPITAIKVSFEGETRIVSAKCNKKGLPVFAETRRSIASEFHMYDSDGVKLSYVDEEGDKINVKTTPGLRCAFLSLPPGSSCLKLTLDGTAGVLLKKGGKEKGKERVFPTEEGDDSADDLPDLEPCHEKHICSTYMLPNEKELERLEKAIQCVSLKDTPFEESPKNVAFPCYEPNCHELCRQIIGRTICAHIRGFCFVEVYNICASYGVLQYSTKKFNFSELKRLWMDSKHMNEYLVKHVSPRDREYYDIKFEEYAGTACFGLLEMALRLGHLKQISHYGHHDPRERPDHSYYMLTDSGQSYIQVVAPVVSKRERLSHYGHS